MAFLEKEITGYKIRCCTAVIHEASGLFIFNSSVLLEAILRKVLEGEEVSYMVFSGATWWGIIKSKIRTMQSTLCRLIKKAYYSTFVIPTTNQ